MTAALDEKPWLRSGRYQYRYWHTNKSGQRIAVRHLPKGRATALPDLVNTAYRNADGSRTVYGLVFDLDAHRANAAWLDGEGRLDWYRMSQHLAETHPEIHGRLTYVVRSTGGKGLALVLAITPLPIIKSTASNQRVALSLQARLITLFNTLGFGADPGARGLERDYPNFRNSERCLMENRLALRRAETAREPTLSLLHSYLNQKSRKAERAARIYPDARAELGIARIFGWLTGLVAPSAPLKEVGFLAADTVWAKTKDLVAFTELSAKFLRSFLKAPPAWLASSYHKEEGWRLCIVLGEDLRRLFPRAEQLLAPADNRARGGRRHAQELPLSSQSIKHPSEVLEDERNAWLTGLSLLYKWQGLSQDEALDKVRMRMEHVPGYEWSRNCRQVGAIIGSLYRNVPETLGRDAGRPLADWLIEDEQFQEIGKGISPRRGVAPVLSLVPCGVGEVVDVTLPKLDPELNPASYFELPQLAIEGMPGDDRAKILKLVAVRWRQRVGIFDGDRLVLCTTKRHYKASAALNMLGSRAEYRGKDLRVHSPHRALQLRYHAQIDACDHVLNSAAAFGRKPTYRDKVKNQEGLSVSSCFQRGLDGEVPF